MNTQDCMMFLVGNQVDNENSREVSQEEGKQYQKENLMAHFAETSAKTGENVEETFIRAAKMLYKKHKNEWGEVNKQPRGNTSTPSGQPL